jgi:hypothetical protein
MRLFNAGLVTSSFHHGGRYYAGLTEAERFHRDANPWYLESYHYVHKQNMLQRMRDDKMKVFLDSGAFSAFTQGITIDIGEYCDYCHRNSDVVLFPSVLDAIGDYKGTYRNQMEMERRGVKPLPCFHYGEPDEVGEHYANNYEYITLGGLVPISTQQMILWLDHVWEKILCHPDGTPKCKVHGFGVTSLPIMLRYPWYSVDSSTWVQWGAMGFILLPRSGRQLNISARSSAAKVAGQHINNISSIERERLEEEIKLDRGDPQRMRDINYPRWAWNAWAFPEYLRLRLEGKPEKFIREQPGLF